MENQNNSANEKAQLKAFVSLLLKNWYYFVVCLGICGVIAVVYLKIKVPVLEVRSMVQLRQNDGLSSSGMSSSQGSSFVSAFLGGSSSASHNIDDETQKMSSQGFVKKVVKEMNLNQMYTLKEYMGFVKTKLYDRSPIVIDMDKSMGDTIQLPLIAEIKVKNKSAVINLKYGKEKLGKYTVTSFPTTIETPVGNINLSESEYRNNYGESLNLKYVLFNYDYITQVIREQLTVDYDKKSSDMIYLGMEDENPLYSIEFINRVINNYNADWDKDKDYVATKTHEYIDQLIQDEKNALADADEKIRVFKEKYELSDIELDIQFYLELVAKIQTTIIEAQVQLDMLSNTYDYVMDEKNKDQMIPLITALESEALSEAISLYNQALVKKVERSQYAPSELTLSLDNQLKAQRQSLIETIESVRDGIVMSINTLREKDQEIMSRIGNVPAVEEEFIALKREQEIHQTVYLYLLQMSHETGISSAAVLPKLKVIDEPYVYIEQVEPNKMKVMITAVLFGGIILPFIIIYGKPYLITFLRRRKNK